MTMRRWALMLALAAAMFTSVRAADPPRPRLVVFVVIDGQSYERFNELRQRFDAKGAFRRLLDGGANYTECFHRHAATETAVSHGTLLTGAFPCLTGIVGNSHFDRETGDWIPAVFDAEVRPVGAPINLSVPTPQTMPDGPVPLRATTRPAGGYSPRNLLVPTVGDMLKLATRKRARVFGISIKDRAAILLAGHAGDGAFWFDKITGRWVTSSHYMPALPDYLDDYNRQRKVDAWRNATWNPLLPKDQYPLYNDDDDPAEDAWPMTPDFPHELAAYGDRAYHSLLITSPFGNEMVLGLARLIVQHEQLGQDETADLLAINLASNDYVNHGFGPFSLEAQDMLLRTDRMLGELMAFLDKQLAGGPWIMVVTADHGCGAIPEWLADRKLPGERIPLDHPERVLEARLGKAFGVPADGRTYVAEITDCEVFLRRDLPELAGDKFASAQRLVRDALLEFKPVAAAFTRETLLATPESAGGLIGMYRRSFNPRLSGDVFYVLAPGQVQSLTPAVHGSPWRFDTHVPLMLIGPGVKPGRYARPVCPVDIAPTLSRLLDVPEPTGCQGHVLREVLGE